MSRRRASLQQLQTSSNSEHDDQDSTDADEKKSRQSSIVQWSWSWLEGASLWVKTEIGQTLFDDKAYESNKILPSVVSFILGLLLVKIYGDSLDGAITKCYVHVKNAFNVSYGLLSRLTSRDIEIVTLLCVLVLFWIGALRILCNLVRQLVQIPRFCSYNS